jgi:glycerol dehydrogenase-like iron-containing ADH family enzyme
MMQNEKSAFVMNRASSVVQLSLSSLAVQNTLKETADDDDDDDDDEEEETATNTRASFDDLRHLESEIDQFLATLRDGEASASIGVGAPIDTAKLCAQVVESNKQHASLLAEVDAFLNEHRTSI